MTSKLVGEEDASEPRKRLAQLLFWHCANVDSFPAQDAQRQTRGPKPNLPKTDEIEREIIRLAKEHPRIFEKDFTQETSYSSSRFSPLAKIVNNFSFNRDDDERPPDTPRLSSPEVFEAAFSAYPESITAVDSMGSTVLIDLIQMYQVGFDVFHRGVSFLEAPWYALLKRVIDKNPAQLAINAPIVCALSNQLPLEVIRYFIEHHPGNPYTEEDSDKGTMLSVVVTRPHIYPFDFVKEVLDKNPDAAKARNIGRNHDATVLLQACTSCSSNPRTLRLIMNADPSAAFVPGSSRELPLYSLIQYMCNDPECFESLEIVTLANPKAIFTTHKEITDSSSGFSIICDHILGNDKNAWTRRGTCQFGWEHLYFLMYVYRYGSKSDLSEAWNEPPFPLHMAASCPCPSKLLLHLARSHPDHLLKIDSQGRSVLALALESGHSIGPTTCGGYEDCGGNMRIEKCIKALVEMDARALGLRDPQTQLFPFQTAAAMEASIFDLMVFDNCCYRPDRKSTNDRERQSEMKKGMEEEASLSCLNTIYYLLRSDPSRARLPKNVSACKEETLCHGESPPAKRVKFQEHTS